MLGSMQIIFLGVNSCICCIYFHPFLCVFFFLLLSSEADLNKHLFWKVKVKRGFSLEGEIIPAGGNERLHQLSPGQAPSPAAILSVYAWMPVLSFPCWGRGVCVSVCVCVLEHVTL